MQYFIFSITSGNLSLQVSQNLSIKIREFETLLCQVRIVKNNQNRKMTGFRGFKNTLNRKTLNVPIFSSHCSTVSYFDLQTFDFFGELDTLRVGQGFTLLRNVSDIQDFAHEVNDRLSWKNKGKLIKKCINNIYKDC